MKARDIMSSPVITVSPEATVEQAAQLMLDRHISCLPVVDDTGKLVGMLTHTDFGLRHRFIPLANNLYRLLGTWASPQTLEAIGNAVRKKRVKEVMAHPVITVQEDADLSEVAELMLRHEVHRLPVMRGFQLIGIITRHDLLKLIASGRTGAEGSSQAR